LNTFRIMMIAAIIAILGVLTYLSSHNLISGIVNVSELDTLDRMRFTAIQMTILSLEAEQPTNLSNDEIASVIYEFQQNNETDRLTTGQIESLYRNITNGSQVTVS